MWEFARTEQPWVNALLSFGYMLLFNELNSLLEASGFDDYVRFSLVENRHRINQALRGFRQAL